MLSFLVNLSESVQMALKRRSFSTISAISNINDNNSITNYRHLTDLSPEVESRSIDVPKKRLFLKKANLNFIRRKKELKSSTSMSNLCDERVRESTIIIERPLSDPGSASRSFGKNGKSYFIYGSFSFGEDRYSKRGCNKVSIHVR